jgi:hypothetical protein
MWPDSLKAAGHESKPSLAMCPTPRPLPVLLILGFDAAALMATGRQYGWEVPAERTEESTDELASPSTYDDGIKLKAA